MIETSKFIPQIYNTSYDFTLFESIIDLIINGLDSQVPMLKGLHSPEQCFEENLGNLAAQFNLRTSDRDLLSRYRLMVKNKGTEKAIFAALHYCGATAVGSPRIESSKTSKSSYHIIYPIQFENFDHDLFDTLTKRLAPFNMQISIELQT